LGKNPGALQGPGTDFITVGPLPDFGEGVTMIDPFFSGGPGGSGASGCVQTASAVAGAGSAEAGTTTVSANVTAATRSTVSRMVASSLSPIAINYRISVHGCQPTGQQQPSRLAAGLGRREQSENRPIHHDRVARPPPRRSGTRLHRVALSYNKGLDRDKGWDACEKN
jgi:hypothetical protein